MMVDRPPVLRLRSAHRGRHHLASLHREVPVVDGVRRRQVAHQEDYTAPRYPHGVTIIIIIITVTVVVVIITIIIIIISIIAIITIIISVVILLLIIIIVTAVVIVSRCRYGGD